MWLEFQRLRLSKADGTDWKVGLLECGIKTGARM